jgi:hypothetical protein
MEVGYQETLEQLTGMFEGFDQETIKSVLAANDGHVERTIEDLLKMSPESGNNARPHEDDDDNLFAEPGPSRKNNNNRRNDDLFGIEDDQKGNRFEDLGIFHDNAHNQGDSYARELQEKEDAAIAYRLQKEYIKQEQELEQQMRNAPRNQSRNQNRPAQSGGMNYGGGEWDFSQPQPASNQPQRNQMNAPPQQGGSGDKKKGSFMNKMKAGFNNIFNKKGKAAKGPTQNAGNYAEIDHLEEHEVYNFSHAEAPQRNGGFQNTNLVPQHNNQYDEEPMQLADILNPRGIENLDSDGEDDKKAQKYPQFDNNFGNNYGNNNNNQHNNDEAGRVSNEHFGFN